MVKKASFDDNTPVADDQSLVTEEQAQAYQRTYSNAPEFDSEDVQYPRLRLAQGLTQEVSDGVAKSGQFVLAGYDPEDSVVVIPLLAAKLRELRDADENSKILCAAMDGKVGVGNPGGDCSRCPKNEWRKNPKDVNKNLPPECSVVYSYVGYSVTHDALVSVDFKKSGTTAAQNINTQIKAKGLGNFAVILSSKAQKGPRGQYYVPTSNSYKATDEDFERARASIAE